MRRRDQEKNMRRIIISDYSLSKLEEERGRKLLFREKTAVCADLPQFFPCSGLCRVTIDR